MLFEKSLLRRAVRPHRSHKARASRRPQFELCEPRTLLSFGPIYATDASGLLHLHNFNTASDVYVGGGDTLSDGSYYIQVTKPGPNGTESLLGTSAGDPTDPTPVHVTGGAFDQIYQLAAIVDRESSILAGSPQKGFDLSSNPGDEYKVWISSTPDFQNANTDNFKVRVLADPVEGTGPTYSCVDVGMLFHQDAPGVVAGFTGGNPPYAAVLDTQPQYAEQNPFVLNSDGSFDYTSNGAAPVTATDTVATFIGSVVDSFNYHAIDTSGNLSNEATTSLIINRTPTTYATAPDLGFVLPGSTTPIPGVFASDPDNNIQSITVGSVTTALDSVNPTTVSVPGGALVITPGQDPTTGLITYAASFQADTGAHGPYTISYSISDDCLTATGSISAVVNTPPQVNSPSFGCVDVPGTFSASVVATDADHDPLALSVIANPTYGTVALANDGSFTYTVTSTAGMPLGVHPVDQFTYKANDGYQDSNIGTVTLTLDRAPVAPGHNYTFVASSALAEPASAGVLSNVSDPDGDPFTLVGGAQTIVTSGGSVALNADGSFVYTPTPGASLFQTGSDSFSYTVTDGCMTATGTVTINLRTIGAGETATIGFWTGPNGQSLIKNAGTYTDSQGISRSLGYWLGTSFPHLYGPLSKKDLTNCTNAQLADYMTATFNVGNTVKLEAQIFDTALDVYFTKAGLGGNTPNLAKYGFKVTKEGVGGAYFNVGSNGWSLGVANNQYDSVLAILQAADQMDVGTCQSTQTTTFVSGVTGKKTSMAITTLYWGNKTSRSACNAIFYGINQFGDIV